MFYYGILFDFTGTVPVAPNDLTAQIVSNQMLMISWTYPTSLLAQTMFEVCKYSNTMQSLTFMLVIKVV